MTALLGKAAFHILFRDKKKKIARFLRTTTPDSVLSDLHTCLLREGIPSITPQDIFHASSIRDSPQEQPYWTKKSFQTHLARTHPDRTIPDTAINVLWSCFCFYAYYPFPLPGAGDKKLELPAFERGFILLSLQGAWLLGNVDDGFGYSRGRTQEPCRCGFRINRIFRSISLSSSDSPVAGSDTFITDDVIDALLPIFPAHPKLFPSIDKQLKPLAERLLDGRTDQYQIKVNDLAALLGLLMRMKVYKPTWGRDFHYGSLEESSPEKEELANILARSFCLGQDEDLAPDSVLRALDILSNLEQWFHQLWTILFQPFPSTETPTLEPECTPDPTMDGILRAASLFIPPFEVHKRTDLARKVKPITFQKFYDSTSQTVTDSLDLGHILQPIFHNDVNRQSHLVLFLGHQAQDSKPVVVGAFFPSSSCTPTPATTEANEPEPEEKMGETRPALPQLLFQLQPTFNLFRWTGEDTSISSSPECTSTSAREHTNPPSNYIGDPIRSKVGVAINSITREATFLQGTAATTAGNQISGGYEEVTRKHDDQPERKTTFTVTRLAIFSVEGGPRYDYPW
ncbi:hypothetical protein BO78DRAFT_356966 [Aspergillus sclerotiicarbonarius CBS 121057]|uniref:TLDc domain-containing protein n=1 Tax=Aspergillus sclerotiicarbonarius (strain CBS 121057 / IBT 28362) TaxID=1448318 RepID=A0A319EQK3_ASPSB|nr:hypothetical protein BO78DRAFT_356966 [Aspergillus sclerotiicarbonarius CBS 121057]